MATVLRPPLYSPRLTVAFPYRAIFDEPQNRLLNLLKSKDKLFGAAGETQVYDYPNPRGPVYNITLRTWLDPLKLNLRGKDKFFGAPGQPPDYDWQNPIRRAVIPQAHTLGNLLETTLGTNPVPFGLDDWPNPLRRAALPTRWESYSNLLETTLAVPFAMRDWPNPLGRSYPVALRTHLNLLAVTLVPLDVLPFSLMDWPNPLPRLVAMQDTNLSVYVANIPEGVVIEDAGAIYIPCFRPRRR